MDWRLCIVDICGIRLDKLNIIAGNVGKAGSFMDETIRVAKQHLVV
jgi:hypothetical protein